MAAPTWVDFYNKLMGDAQKIQAQRNSDPNFGIHYQSGKNDVQAAVSGKKSGHSFMDNLWNNNLSVGKRIIDVLSRGNYASANVAKTGLFDLAQSMVTHNPTSIATAAIKAQQGELNPTNVIKEGWQGLSGKDKTTYSDVLKERGIDGLAGGALGFGFDVLADPTTYIGVGAVKSLLRGGTKLTGVADAEKAINKSAKITPASVKTTGQRAAEDLAVNGQTTLPVGQAEKFIRSIDRSIETPGQGVFDSIVKTELPTSATSKTFSVTPEGVATEVGRTTPSIITDPRFLLGGAHAPVVAERASMAAMNNLARGIPRFEYGSAVDTLDEFGPFRQITEQVPLNDVPQVRPKGTAAKQVISDFTEPTTKDLTANTVLRKLDEPVYSDYTIKTAEDGNKYFVPKTDADGNLPYKSTIGELRKIAEDASADPKLRQAAHQMLKNHISVVRRYAQYLEKNKLGTAKNYLKAQYPSEFEAARVATGGRKKAGAIADLPPGPAELAKAAEPTFKEVTRIEKMDFIDREIYFHNMQQTAGLSDADMAYLRSASNPKSFATRMAKIKTKVKEGGTTDVADLINAIKTGQIQSVEEAGLDKIMKATGAKTLKGLVQKLEQMQGRLTKAEQKMLGNVVENPVTKKTLEASAATRELGPTGLPYKPYEGRAAEAMTRAKQIINDKVEPASKIYNDAKAGDKAALSRPASTLTVEQGKIFDKAMQWAIDHEVVQPRNKELWAYLTKRGTLRTSKVMNKGAGRNRGAWNKYSQYTFFKDMMGNAEKIDPQIKKILDDASIRGADRGYARASAMYDVMMPVLKSMDDVLKQGGVFPVGGKGIADNPFSLFDVLHALPPDFVKRRILNMRKTKSGVSSIIAPTQLMDAVNYAVDIMKTSNGEITKDAISNMEQILLEVQKTRNGKTVPNGLRSLYDNIKDPQQKSNLIEDVVDEIAQGMPEIFARVERNVAERALYHENKIVQGTKESLETLANRIVDSTESMADITGLAPKINTEIVDKVSRLRGIDPNDEFMVREAVTAELPSLGITPEMQAQGRLMNQAASATTTAERNTAMRAQSKLAEEESGKIAEEIGTPLSDLGTRIEQKMGYRLLKAFAPHFGNADVRPYFLDRKSVAQSLGRGYQSLLSNINKNHTKDAILSAWKELQHGTRSTDTAIAAAQDDILQAVHTLFTKDPQYNVFVRNNVSAADINAHMKHFGIHEKYRFEDGLNNDAWRTWDTDNPLDLLARMQAATMAATSKRLLGEDLSYRFGSTTKQAGYVKIAPGKSVLAHYLDLDKYYPRDVAKQFKILDDFIKESMQPAKYNQMTNFLDNVLHSYKAGLTIYRPGHHVRNMVGDVWLSHMAGVNNPKYYTKAAKIMAQNHGRYRDFDAIRALQARQPVGGTGKFVDDGSTMVKVHINGKIHDMTAGDVYRAAYDHGILPDYRTLEDIQFGSESLGDKLRKVSPFKGKVQQKAASFSEARDHYVRLAHFMSDLEKGGYKSLDEAIAKSAHNVRKWHPDGSDLTHFESKVMRRSFLFYSWIRKAMPLVVESMVLHPGKVMIYPKAMYNIAEANGIDLESLSDPFPQDQLFPDWITDSPIGPIMQNGGHYLGVNPGVPMVDVLNDYAGTQAGRTILGSTNPFIKIPIETISAQNEPAVAEDLRTGIKSYDMTDYIDRQLPFGTYLTGITGRSPSSLFTQTRGNKEEPTKNAYAFANLLSGMGVFDMSKPSYQKQARKDAKTRYMRQAEGG